MNPILRRCHRALLRACIFVALLGFVLMFWRQESWMLDLGAALALGAGALSIIPLFYFSSQVAFRDQEGDEKAEKEE
ncbi:MAG: hypothetical protein ACQKBY_06695 [Verrucomicrobiales bacterium]